MSWSLHGMSVRDGTKKWRWTYTYIPTRWERIWCANKVVDNNADTDREVTRENYGELLAGYKKATWTVIAYVPVGEEESWRPEIQLTRTRVIRVNKARRLKQQFTAQTNYSPPSRIPCTSSTGARSERNGHRSVNSVSCGSLNHDDTGTALLGWKM